MDRTDALFEDMSPGEVYCFVLEHYGCAVPDLLLPSLGRSTRRVMLFNQAHRAEHGVYWLQCERDECRGRLAREVDQQ